MSFEEFKKEVLDAVKSRPVFIRKGQAVFNYVDETFGAARTAQFEYGVDCFYNDNKIEDFLDVCYHIITDTRKND